MIFAALLLFAAAPAPEAAAPRGTPLAQARAPVAVMPFKNLGGDASLDWMSAGIADTMVSDLRRAKVSVVERDQIARALGEILSASGAGAEDSTAAKVGRLVGARTVVVGGYQQAGKQLRINARFVEVETGVVQEAAKATGTLADPFAVQDQVVDQLLGRAAAARPARKTSAKTPDAYKLYAQAAAVATDADRAPLLEKAVEIDPDFVYAKDALAALELRLRALSEARDKDALVHEAELRAIAFDEKLPGDKRAPAAADLLYSMMHGRRFHRLLFDAKRLTGTDLKLPIGHYPIAELADFSLVLGNSSLKRLDASLQAGEQFLKHHPRSNFFLSVQNMVKMDLEEKKARAEAPEKEAAALQALLAKEAALAPDDPKRYVVESDLCSHAANKKLHELAITRCQAFYRRWAADERPHVRELVRRAGTNVVRSQWELGQPTQARAFAHEMLAATPDDFDAGSVRAILGALPTDSLEDAR